MSDEGGDITVCTCQRYALVDAAGEIGDPVLEEVFCNLHNIYPSTRLAQVLAQI